VVCKVTAAEEVATVRTLTEVGRENGFVFFRREP
jgi:hypothetical protein